MKLLVRAINHFTIWETSESTSEIIPFRMGIKQGKIRKILTGNIIPAWVRHTLIEEISLVGTNNMTVTQSITRKLKVEIWQRGCHRTSLIVIKMVGFRKKGKPIPNGERSFSGNQRMNNEAYKS